MKTYLARLKKHDPRHGHFLRRYTYKGIRFQAGRGWYEVSDAVAEHLKTVRQRNDNPHSQLAFDVCLSKDALKLDKKEAEEKEAKRPAERAKPVVARGEEKTSAKKTKKKSAKPSETEPQNNDDTADTAPKDPKTQE